MRDLASFSALVLVMTAASAAVSTSIPAGAARASDIPKELLQERDPFKMPMIPHASVPRSELEMYPVDQYKLIGVLEGGDELRAMVAAPSGKTFFVKRGTVIGARKGAIRRITETAILVREKVTNALGEPENVDTVLKLPADDKHDVKMTNLEQGW